jgi:hypothetical protein
MMGLSFVILFPLGAIIIRFLAAYLPGPTRIHYITQIASVLIVLTAMGLGVYLSVGDQFNHFRASPTYPVLTSRSNLRYCDHRSCRTSIVAGILSPPSLPR